ncbi:MAG: imidazole glycerol phosphate synthase subunit HisF [Archaeoglobaceae archaeon]|nr:imidazole glycerol phosphate synthase subunit HisF [Archaeoglobaceae archaeon]MCX8151678.1 imidazole glycerol phosphate synthase subunit HisF [Archaeoglobaceae archaeon]MDW8013044.1 imidazole glycerol phosphate synthase subunit HisF [Archaeoglobaceae archaeon]
MKTKFKRVIPCLDVKVFKDGEMVVKGVEFENVRIAGDPLTLAKRYNDEGADELVFLDISASIEGRKTVLNVVKKIVEKISIPLIVGGGISSVEDMEKILSLGASKVSIGTSAFLKPELIKRASEKFGSEKIVAAIDCKRNFSISEKKNVIELEDGKRAWYEVMIYGGKKATGFDAVEWAKKVEDLGAGEILLTSVDRDGTKLGYDIPITRAISEEVRIPVIASGGAGKFEHFYDAIVYGKADAVLAASVFHFREIEIKELKKYLANRGINVKIYS